MKQCYKCKIEKELSEFHKDKNSKDKLYCYCKECEKKWREEHQKYLSQYRKKLRKEKYWYNSYNLAKSRCENPNNQDFHLYGGRGIKFLLTQEECARIWNRDKGWLLKQHSIDRKDSNGHYEFDNCRFIEQTLNIQLANYENKKKSIVQLKDDKIIKIWNSVTEASSHFNVTIYAISKCLTGKCKTSCGFEWKYKERNKMGIEILLIILILAVLDKGEE